MSAYTEPKSRPKPYGAIFGPTTPPAPDPPAPRPPTALKPREQFFSEFRQVNDFYASEDGLQRPGGMVIDGRADTEAMAAWGYDLMAGRSVDAVKASIRQSEEWRAKHPEGDPPPAGVISPFNGPLRREGKWWADNSGIISPIGAGALYALLADRDWRRYIDSLVGQVQFVRVFAGPLVPTGNRLSLTKEEVYERLPGFLDYTTNRGLGVQVVCLTDTRDIRYDWVAHVRAIAKIAQRFFNVTLAIANELHNPFQRSELDAATARLLIERAREAGFTGLITVGTHLKGGANNSRQDEIDPGTGDYYAYGGDFNSLALTRGLDPWYREVCRLREAEGIQNRHQRPVEDTERNRAEDTANPLGFSFVAGFLAGGFGLSSVFHSGQARDCQPLTGVQLEAFKAFQRGHGCFRGTPMPWVFKNARWSDSPVHTASFEDPIDGDLPGRNIWRAYSFLNGNVGLVLVVGSDPLRGAIDWQNGWTPVGKDEPAPGVVVISIKR